MSEIPQNLGIPPRAKILSGLPSIWTRLEEIRGILAGEVDECCHKGQSDEQNTALQTEDSK